MILKERKGKEGQVSESKGKRVRKRRPRDYNSAWVKHEGKGGKGRTRKIRHNGKDKDMKLTVVRCRTVVNSWGGKKGEHGREEERGKLAGDIW